MSAAAHKQHALVTIAPLYLNREHAAAFLSLSESKFEALVAAGEAPAARQVSKGRVAWLVEELVAWGKARPVSQLLPPAGSGHGRRGKPVTAESQA